MVLKIWILWNFWSLWCQKKKKKLHVTKYCEIHKKKNMEQKKFRHKPFHHGWYYKHKNILSRISLKSTGLITFHFFVSLHAATLFRKSLKPPKDPMGAAQVSRYIRPAHPYFKWQRRNLALSFSQINYLPTKKSEFIDFKSESKFGASLVPTCSCGPIFLWTLSKHLQL